MTNMEQYFVDKIYISRLANNASSLFGIKPVTSKKLASRFIHSGFIQKNDSLLNHSGIESYTVPMLLKYHILTKKQILQNE